jgi:hypothetical protein
VDVAYEAMTRLTRIKAKYRQIPQQIADAQVAYFMQGKEMVQRIDELVQSGNADDIVKLKPEMDRINNFRAVQHRQLDVPMGMFRPQNIIGIWNALFKK